MNDPRWITRRLPLLLAGWVTLSSTTEVTAQSVDPSTLQWGLPTIMPTGAMVAILSGDPTGPGECTFLISMPNGYRIPPHFHPGAVHVAVREGELLIGTGDRMDAKRSRVLAAGDSATTPAGMHHSWITRGSTLVSLSFTGPFAITYLRADMAPRSRVFPLGY